MQGPGLAGAMPSMRDPALYPTARHATCTLADREQRLCLALAAMKCMRRPAVPFNVASQRHQVPCLEQAPQERHRGRRPCAGQRLSASLGFKGCALPAGSSNSNCCRNDRHAGEMFQQRHNPGAYPTACWQQDAKIIVVGLNHSKSLRVGDQ